MKGSCGIVKQSIRQESHGDCNPRRSPTFGYLKSKCFESNLASFSLRPATPKNSNCLHYYCEKQDIVVVYKGKTGEEKTVKCRLNDLGTKKIPDEFSKDPKENQKYVLCPNHYEFKNFYCNLKEAQCNKDCKGSCILGRCIQVN